MNPKRIRIAGIGPHHETVLDFSDDELIAITGANGSGKTLAMESIVAALYGDFASYPGGMATNLRIGGTGEARIEFEFSHRGKEYRIVRELKGGLGATPKQRAWIYEGEAPLAGPKVTDMETRVADLFGDRRLALATWFNARGRRGDLTTASPADRRAVFGDLLGFERFNRIADRCKSAAAKSEAAVEVLAAQLADTPDFDSEIASRTEELADAASRLGAVRSEIETLRRKLTAERETRATIMAKIARINDFRAGAARAKSAMAETQARVNRLESDARAAEALIARIPDFQSAVVALDELRAERSALDLRRQMWMKHEHWRRMADSLRDNLAGLEQVVAARRSVPGLDSETEALAAALPAIEEEYRQSKRMAEETLARNRKIETDRRGIEAAIAMAEEELNRLRRRAQSRPETPAPPDVCDRCPLMRDWADVPTQIATQELRIGEARGKLAAFIEANPIIEPPDLEPIIQRGSAAREAAKRLAAIAEAQAALVKAESDMAAASAKLAAHLATEPERADDPTDRIIEIQVRIDAIADAPARLAEAERAFATAENIRREIETETKRLNQFQLDVAASEKQLIALQSDATAEALRRIDTDATMIEESISASERMANALAAEIGAGRAAVDRLEADRTATMKKRMDLDSARTRGADFRTLAQAFGSRGIQPILIDRATPELEAIANDLLNRATQGRHQLRIATQAATRKGEVIEAFSILIRDAFGERDVAQYSGGELQIIQTVLRIAVALWVSRLNSIQPECLIIDEAMNDLDAENKALGVNVFRSLSGLFERIIVITPEPTVAELFPARITFAATFCGVTIEDAR
jgi:DNA repair exonuclease SbcCD ATPase subunit